MKNMVIAVVFAAIGAGCTTVSPSATAPKSVPMRNIECGRVGISAEDVSVNVNFDMSVAEKVENIKLNWNGIKTTFSAAVVVPDFKTDDPKLDGKNQFVFRSDDKTEYQLYLPRNLLIKKVFAQDVFGTQIGLNGEYQDINCHINYSHP